MGMSEVARDGDSVYLRVWAEHDLTTLKLTAAPEAGIRHIGWRAMSADALERRAKALEATGQGIGWIEGDVGHGPAYQFRMPAGHLMEVYWDRELYEADPELKPYYKNMPQRMPSHGAGIRKLDHLHVLTDDVPANRGFLADELGFKLRENIVLDDGREISSWNSVSPIVHEIAVSLDAVVGARGRLHHVGWLCDNREDVLRAADIMAENGIFIETGPGKHKISHQYFMYVYEPGGNRIELVTQGYLIFEPDWKTVTWTEADRRDGQAWGLRMPASFHAYGTPEVDLESAEQREIPIARLG
ncbi:MAG: catechol 2,3-dioxygenase [Solirubrobacterales bacterium]|nr:catechol 2,3-dioxygenase [Solirubrobacterales bacterium]